MPATPSSLRRSRRARRANAKGLDRGIDGPLGQAYPVSPSGIAPRAVDALPPLHLEDSSAEVNKTSVIEKTPIVSGSCQAG